MVTSDGKRLINNEVNCCLCRAPIERFSLDRGRQLNIYKQVRENSGVIACGSGLSVGFDSEDAKVLVLCERFLRRFEVNQGVISSQEILSIRDRFVEVHKKMRVPVSLSEYERNSVGSVVVKVVVTLATVGLFLLSKGGINPVLAAGRCRRL